GRARAARRRARTGARASRYGAAGPRRGACESHAARSRPRDPPSAARPRPARCASATPAPGSSLLQIAPEALEELESGPRRVDVRALEGGAAALVPRARYAPRQGTQILGALGVRHDRHDVAARVAHGGGARLGSVRIVGESLGGTPGGVAVTQRHLVRA